MADETTTTRHVFKSSYGQCSCLWCGRGSPINNGPCFATDDIRARVAAFAAQHGRTWKSKLRLLWILGKDEGLLRQARNIIGARRLDRITPRMLSRYQQPEASQS